MGWETWVWLSSWFVSLILAVALLKFLVVAWWRPLRIERCFRAQGIRGPAYKLARGNLLDIAKMLQQAKASPIDFSHHILPSVLPYIDQWIKEYGKTFLYWFGPQAHLVVTEPELIKEIFVRSHENYLLPQYGWPLNQVTGSSLSGVTGAKWDRQRKIANRAFHAQDIKDMVQEMVRCCQMMVEKWKISSPSSQNGCHKVEVYQEFRVLTSELIARTGFGFNYLEAKNIFELQARQATLVFEAIFNVPGYRFIPTHDNSELKALQDKINRGMRKLIESRVEMVSRCGKLKEVNKKKDLLDLLLEANNEEVGESRISFQTLVDECKNIFTAGQVTTTSLLTWTLILLAAHKDWQEKARKEVAYVLKGDPPNSDILNRLKIVNMILLEALRLYAPITAPLRVAAQDGYIGNIFVPKGVELFIPFLAIHHDPDLWGDDAEEFNPGRFANGVAKAAKHPMAFMGFGMGPRTCVGQNYALMVAKVAVATILQHFSIDVYPDYVHAPTQRLALHPQYGAQVIVKAL